MHYRNPAQRYYLTVSYILLLITVTYSGAFVYNASAGARRWVLAPNITSECVGFFFHLEEAGVETGGGGLRGFDPRLVVV